MEYAKDRPAFGLCVPRPAAIARLTRIHTKTFRPTTKQVYLGESDPCTKPKPVLVWKRGPFSEPKRRRQNRAAFRPKIPTKCVQI